MPERPLSRSNAPTVRLRRLLTWLLCNLFAPTLVRGTDHDEPSEPESGRDEPRDYLAVYGTFRRRP